MRQQRGYKSPGAALVWSMVLPGFGQLYNKNYFIGGVLIVFEILVNVYSNLNLALLYSIKGDFLQAHEIINFKWGLFYPSLYCFSLWHAYNIAIANNAQVLHHTIARRTYLTGFFIGMVIGMDLGLMLHDYTFLGKNPVTFILDMPVFNGLILGLVLGYIGHLIEKTVRKTILN
ncbi:hypothetical protein [Bacillus sp. MRMR6]|uniref:DUF5683 domain-containing protein n=1 Tax=Bacillus sp. MRMR6 TaxID=1928617 RepID=UPI000951FDA7|nr:hypothetical protein [Bacillus sp. MRMR6]OLS41114.1 hypothetical protein BTR25_04405 [Bacillus sp. MRMR6]